MTKPGPYRISSMWIVVDSRDGQRVGQLACKTLVQASKLQPDGEDLLALSQDAQEFGENALSKRRERIQKDREAQKHVGEGI